MVSAAEEQPSSLLESLPARPPTPPRELRSHARDPATKDITAAPPLACDLLRLQTPPGVLSPATSSGTSTSRRKRVGFSARAQYQEPPLYTAHTSVSHAQSPLAPSHSASKPVKGILKQTAVPNRLAPVDGLWLDFDKPGQVNVAAMLESTLQQLAGADRDSKVDAYTMLFRGLKASSNLPDRIALQDKMGLFTQFIQRDLSQRALAGTWDVVLLTSALKLLHTFLGFPGIASSVPRDFGVFLLDHCASAFEESQVPKEVVRHLMQALYLQKFPPEVMTCDRLGRLIKALHGIENHISGKSIVQSRIRLYDRLIRQCPQHMIVHADWLQDLFQDMFSSIKEVRVAATKFGLQAAFAFSTERRMAVRVLDLLHRSDGDKEYIDLIIERLDGMLRSKEDSFSVPQIWSIVHLFVPNPRKQVWSKPWADIVGRSFNNSSALTKKEANLAWGRLIHRTFLDKSLHHKESMCVLRDTMLQQLMRKGLHHSSLESILNTIRIFFFYIFSPDSSHKNLDDAWDIAVSPLLLQLLKIDQGNTSAANAAAILAGVFDSQTRRVWKRDRIMDAAIFTSQELPAIDPKWIRSNSYRVLQVVDSVLAKGFAELSVAGSPCQQLWHALVTSVASASTKDVKLHDDTARFVADALTFLASQWTQGLGDGQTCSSVRFLESAQDFLLTLIHGLGLLPNPFVDRYFIRTRDNRFFLQNASAHRTSQGQGTKRQPLHHLFQILSHLPPGIPDNDATAQFFGSVFAPFFHDKSTKVQFALSQELLRLLPVDAYCPYGIWALCALKASALLEDSHHERPCGISTAGDGSWPEYRDMVKLLERGLRSTPDLPWSRWSHLFHKLTSHIQTKIGDPGVAILVVEQLADVVNDMLEGPIDSSKLRSFNAATEILSVSKHPRDKEAVDAARQRLWGTPTTSTPLASFDPFDNMYKLASSALEKAYMNIECCSQVCIPILEEVAKFFDCAHGDLAFRALTAIQHGFIPWLKDENGALTKPSFLGVYEALRSLWQRIGNFLATVSAEKFPLVAVEPLLCAAFYSRYREIVRTTADAWNSVFQGCSAIEYPTELKQVLILLGDSFDIKRPGLGPFEMEWKANHTSDGAISVPLDTPELLQGTIDLLPTMVESDAKEAKETIKMRKDKQSHAPLTRSTVQTRSRKKRCDQGLSDIDLGTAPLAFPQRIGQQQQHESVEPHRALTPDQDPDFENYVESTPTPRRGQPMLMRLHDQEMADPPSSPPEPRASHLLAELKARARDVRSLDDWQFSSSPVSGSPISAAVDIPASQPMDMSDINDAEMCLDEETTVELHTSSIRARQGLGTSSLLETGSYEVQGAASDRHTTPTVVTGKPQQPPTFEAQALPERHLRSRTVPSTSRYNEGGVLRMSQSVTTASPIERITRQRSVAASPRKSPRQAAYTQSPNTSTGIDEPVNKATPGQVEMPLRSSQRSSPRKKEYTSFTDILPESPEQSLEHQQSHQAADYSHSIEVVDVRKRGRPRKEETASDSQASESSSLHKKITIIDGLTTSGLQDIFENVSPGNGQWLRKRKSSVSSAHSTGDAKRARLGEGVSKPDEPSTTGQSATGLDGDRPLETHEVPEPRQDEVTPVSTESCRPAAAQPSELVSVAVKEPRMLAELPVASSPNLINELPDRMLIDDMEGVVLDDDGGGDDDIDDDDDDEDAVHSQLVREQQASSGAQSQSQPQLLSDPLTLPREQQQKQHSNHIVSESKQKEVASPAAPSIARQAVSAVGTFASLMDMFRKGLAALRSVDLSREQVYQAEDIMFEMRKELVDAERRGRP